MKENKLGLKAKDKITGFEGIITSEHNYLHAATSYGITPPVDKDGNHRATQYFEKDRIEIID